MLKYKKCILLLLVLFICAMPAVSAEDITDVSDNAAYAVSVQADEVSVEGNFSNLADAIENAEADDTIYLGGDVVKDESEQETYQYGIEINKDITIDGNGYTIDANDSGRIFKIMNGSTLTLQNVILANGAFGAIYAEDGSISLGDNIAFINNTASSSYGGAISVNGAITISGDNISFIGNDAKYGGAIYSTSNIKIDGSNILFENNTATSSGSAIRAEGNILIDGTNVVFIGAESSTTKNIVVAMNRLDAVNTVFLNGAVYSKAGDIDNNYWGNINPQTLVKGGITVDSWVVPVISGPSVVLDKNTTEYTITLANVSDSDKLADFDLKYGDEVISLENGQATINYTATNPGEGTITIADATTNTDVATYKVYYKLDTLVNVSADTIVEGDTATIVGNVTLANGNAATGNVTIIVNGKSYTVELTDGKFSQTIEDLKDGSYEVTVNYNGADNALTSSNSTTLTVLEKTIITVEKPDINFNYGEDVVIQGNLTDADGNPLDGTVTIRVTVGENASDYQDYNVTVIDGKFSLTLSDLPVPMVNGAVTYYFITVNYNGTDVYAASTFADGDYWFKVNPTDSLISIDEIKDVVYGENVTITGTVTDDAGRGIDATIKVTINGEEYTVNATNGKFVIEIPNIDAGVDYEATVEVADSNYIPSSTTGKFNVNKVDTEITLEIEEIYYVGQTAVIKGTLVDANGNPITADIAYNINNGAQNIVSVVNGTFTIEIEGQYVTLGNNTVNVWFNTDGTLNNYVGSEDSVNFTTIKANPTVIVDADSVTSGDDVVIEGTITGVNNEKVNGQVNITVNGKTYTVTATDGEFTQTIAGLDNGVYDVEVAFLGNEKYNAANATTTFSISEADLTVDVDDVIYGDNLVISGTLIDIFDKPLNGEVIITVNGEEYTANVTNGKYNITVSGVPAGEYEVEVYFPGDEEYLETTATTPVVVEKQSSNVTINVDDIELSEDATITGNVTGADGEALEGTVTITVNEKEYNVTLVDGAFTLTVANLTMGTYDVEVVFNGNDNYNVSEETAEFDVTKIATDIELDMDDIIFVGENATITGTLTDSFGNALNNTTVTITIGGDNHKVNVTDGEFSLVLENLTIGDYYISVKYDGTENLTSSSASVVLQVRKEANIDAIINETIFVGENATITGNVTDAEGNPLTGEVEIEIGNQTITVDVVNGTFTAVVEGLEAGDYIVYVTYLGDDEYAQVSTTLEISVEDSYVITADNVTIYYKNGTDFIIVVTANDKPVANANVTIVINGQEYIRTTDENGTISMAINLDPGVYEAVVSYGNTTVTATITVLTTLETSDLIKYYKNGSQFSVIVLDGQGNPVANATVTFNINGVYYNRTTDENGVATLNINLNPGQYTITSVGPDGYEIGNTVTVLPTVIVDDLTKYFQNSSQYEITVVDEEGNPIANRNVTININGVFYTRTTDENGVATLNINLQPGEYIATVLDPVSGLQVSSTVNVLPTLVGEDLIKAYNESAAYEVTLVDGTGAPVAGQNITMNINGVFYQRTTDADGVARLNINLQPGEYILTATYGNSVTSNTIVVE